LQHGFPQPEYFPATATHYLVWGAAMADYMEQHSPGAATSFVALGAPRLDAMALLHERHPDAKSRLEQLGLRHSDKLNLLFLSPSHSRLFTPIEHKWVLSLVAEMAGLPEVHLIVRRHPQEAYARFRQPAAQAQAAHIPASVSLIESVLGSDVVISVDSTAMLEAALLGTPVVQISAARFDDRVGPLRFPRFVGNPETARAVLLALCHPIEREACLAEQQTLIEAHFGPPGVATKLAWWYIQQIAGASRQLSASAGN
jgi:hypothetical protein